MLRVDNLLHFPKHFHHSSFRISALTKFYEFQDSCLFDTTTFGDSMVSTGLTYRVSLKFFVYLKSYFCQAFAPAEFVSIQFYSILVIVVIIFSTNASIPQRSLWAWSPAIDMKGARYTVTSEGCRLLSLQYFIILE